MITFTLPQISIYMYFPHSFFFYLHNSLSIIQREQTTPNWGSSTEHIQDFTSYHQVMRTVDAGKISKYAKYYWQNSHSWMVTNIQQQNIPSQWQNWACQLTVFLPKFRIAVHCNKNTTLLKTSAKKHVRSVWRPKISHFCMRKFFPNWKGVIFCTDLFF